MLDSKAFAAGFKPDTRLTVSQWADKNRILNSKTSAEPGKWRTQRTPFLREVMDCLSAESGVETIVFWKPTQVGGTECGNNWLGYVVEHVPGPMMYVLPTVELAKRSSKQRIQPMIDECAALDGRIKDNRSRDSGNTVLQKDFNGGTLIITGANSAAGLRSMPAKYLFFDEIDAYPKDVDGEGDPADLAIKRSDTFKRTRKIFKNSTCTLEGDSAIVEAYNETDQCKYHVPCPHCEHKQTLEWRGIHWDKDDSGNYVPGSVRYICEACGEHISEGNKTWMLDNGEWIASVETDGKARGFWLNALYSPLGWYSWEQAVTDFLKAKRSKNPKRLKTFTNTVLAETWKEAAVKIEHSELFRRREHYGAEVPGGVLLTCGVDVQDDRIEGEVFSWASNEEKWSVDYFVLNGDPSRDEIWNKLDERLLVQYTHECGVIMPIVAVGIDTGGHYTQEVYNYVQRRPNRRIFALKGSSTAGIPVANKPKRVGAQQIPLYMVGTDTAKDIIYARLAIADPGPGYTHFPIDHKHDEEYFRQLAAEERRVKYKNGFPYQVYVKAYQRNEVVDCHVYGYTALLLLNPVWSAIERNFEKKMSETDAEQGENDQPSNDAVPKSNQRQRNRKRGGYLNRFSR